MRHHSPQAVCARHTDDFLVCVCVLELYVQQNYHLDVHVSSGKKQLLELCKSWHGSYSFSATMAHRFTRKRCCSFQFDPNLTRHKKAIKPGCDPKSAKRQALSKN